MDNLAYSKDEVNKRHREIYAYRRRIGLCVRCGRKAEEGKPLCLICKMDKRENAKVYRAKHREHVAETKSMWHKRKIEERRKDGICTYCGKQKVQNGYALCDSCRSKTRIRQRERYKPKLIHPYIERKDWFNIGYCNNCGKNPVKEGFKVCESCYEKSYERLEKARKQIVANKERQTMNNNNEAPCKGCVQRTAECHASCARYTDYQQKKFAEYEMRVKTADRSYANAMYYRKSAERVKRNKKA